MHHVKKKKKCFKRNAYMNMNKENLRPRCPNPMKVIKTIAT